MFCVIRKLTHIPDHEWICLKCLDPGNTEPLGTLITLGTNESKVILGK